MCYYFTVKQPQLTNKQKVFVETYLSTGVGAEAARSAYNIPIENKQLAAVIASENLRKPNIVEAIRRGTKDDKIDEAFDKLINLKRIEYFTFPHNMADDEIVSHIEAQGITVLNIQRGDRGKYAFYAIPDGQALGRALDIWAKISDAYAAKKNINVNLNKDLEPSEKVKDLTKKLNYGT